MGAVSARQVEDAPILLSELDAGVLRLTLNNPARRNSLSEGMMTALKEALDKSRSKKLTWLAQSQPKDGSR